MTDDIQLLTQFATKGDEDAFRELADRHLDLVYSVALRRVNGDASLAEDVTQMVFTDLARKARTLPRDIVLPGWLYEAARFAASSTVRGERRRQAREQEALNMQSLTPECAPGWEQLCPVLDVAMGELSPPDRNAILLRYFQNQDFQAVGRALGVSDAAAQRRVSRAVDRLREFFSKHGVTVGTSGFLVVISANAVQRAPVGLSVTVSNAALLAGKTFTATATATATNAMAMTTLQKTLVGVLLVAAMGTGIHETRKASSLQKHILALEQQHAALTEELARDREDAASRLAAVRDGNSAELARLRSEVTRLRRDAQVFARGSANSGQPTNGLPAVAAILVTNTAPRAVGEDQIRAAIQTRVGEPFHRATVDQDVRGLYATGLFSNIRVIENSNHLGITLTYVVSEKPSDAQVSPRTFENQGMATPEAGIQTFLWAAQSGDSNLVSQMLRWRRERDDVASDELVNQITAAQARGGFNSFSNVVAFRILGKESELPDMTRLRIAFDDISGTTRQGEIYMIREDGNWKPALYFTRRDGSQTVSAQFLLPTARAPRAANQ